MIDFETILAPSNVKFISNCRSRKSALEYAANLISETSTSLDSRDLLDRLTEREELGSTALEDTGVAIPHCRIENCRAPVAALLRLNPDVQFGIGEHIELILALAVPNEENIVHLQILQVVAAICNNPENVTRLLGTQNPAELRDTFMTLATRSNPS